MNDTLFHVFSLSTTTTNRDNHTKALAIFITALDTANDYARADEKGTVASVDYLPAATATDRAGYHVTITAGTSVKLRLERDFPRYIED